MAEETCFIALGTNLGERLRNLTRARMLLAEKVEILRTSSIYETEPWGVKEQPMFLNQVIEGRTTLEALALLKFLKHIEQTLGRRKTFRYGPRLIDLDILTMDDITMNTPELTLPHPRMTERAFVLVPLAELAPYFVLPGTQKTVTELLSGIESSGVRKFEGAA